MKQKTKLAFHKKKIAFAGPSITKQDVRSAVDGVMNGFYETFNQHVEKFEKAVCSYTGITYGIATSCCSHALHLACLSLGLKAGDEVICPDTSWVATAYSIVYTGATPIFVDIDPETWCISPEAIEKAITKKTKAIMLVHTFGHPAEMDTIMAIAYKYNLFVIEDAAPSLGSRYKGKHVGSFGDIGCISFHGAKIAVAGQGGIFLTNNATLYQKAQLLSTMGRTDRKMAFWSDVVGYKYQMANLTASLALSQVKRIDQLVAKKRQIYTWYEERLHGISGIQLLKEQNGCFSNYCYPSLLLGNTIKKGRDELLLEWKALNIHGRAAFPRMSQFPVFDKPRFDNPVAGVVEKRGLTLPAALNLTERDIDFVCKALRVSLT